MVAALADSAAPPTGLPARRSLRAAFGQANTAAPRMPARPEPFPHPLLDTNPVAPENPRPPK